MGTSIERKQTSFRLRIDLLRKRQVAAHNENRSLNNLVESTLMDAMNSLPNAETLEAMEEARLGKNLETVDVSSFEAFIKYCSKFAF